MSLHVEFEINPHNGSRVTFIDEQRVALTEANHVCVSGDVNINNVMYRHSTHLYRQQDGSWVLDSIRQGKSNHERYQDIHLSVVGDFGKEPTLAAKVRAAEFLPGLISGALKSLSNIDELRQKSEIKHLQYRLGVDEEEAKDLREKLNDLMHKIALKKDALENAKKGILPDAY